MQSPIPRTALSDEILCQHREFAFDEPRECVAVDLSLSMSNKGAEAEVISISSMQQEPQRTARLVEINPFVPLNCGADPTKSVTYTDEERGTVTGGLHNSSTRRSTVESHHTPTEISRSIEGLDFDFQDANEDDTQPEIRPTEFGGNQDACGAFSSREEETYAPGYVKSVKFRQVSDMSPTNYGTAMLMNNQSVEIADHRGTTAKDLLWSNRQDKKSHRSFTLVGRNDSMQDNAVEFVDASSRLSDLIPIPDTVLQLLGEIDNQMAHDEQISYPPSMTMSSPESISPATDNTLLNSSPPASLGYSLASACRNHDENDVFYDSLTGQLNSCDISTPTAACRKRRQRNFSTNFPFSPLNKPSLPLRANCKTKESVFLFRSNSPDETGLRIPAPHRRKISFGLPVDVLSAQSAERSQATTTNSSSLPDEGRAALRQAESELEYKHRHTFVGTASLDDFLETLEMSPKYTTTKRQIAKAFVLLASNEQIYARQASARPEGWELVSRITHDVTNMDFIAQAHIKLGSIPLRNFLELIPFDENDEVGVMSVVEAFCAVCHMDRKAGNGAGSKARAFRNWAVKQINSMC